MANEKRNNVRARRIYRWRGRQEIDGKIIQPETINLTLIGFPIGISHLERDLRQLSRHAGFEVAPRGQTAKEVLQIRNHLG